MVLPTLVGVTPASMYRPEAIIWVDATEDLVVALTIQDPAGPRLTGAEVLQGAMGRPMAGPPRRPARVRVADKQMAAAIRSLFRGTPEVVEAPTPELHAVMASMAQHFAADGEERSYLEDGASPNDLAALFTSARELYELAPWLLVDEEDTLRLDVPSLGVHGACVSVIGVLGQNMGFLVFPSHEHFERYVAAAEAVESASVFGAPIDMGTTLLSLNFERGRSLPAGMKREVKRHGWPVAGPAAYPVIERRDRDGFPLPVSPADVSLLSLCAGALTAFVRGYREVLEVGGMVTGSERYLVDGQEVLLTIPSDAQPGRQPRERVPALAAQLELVPPPKPRGPKAGRPSERPPRRKR